MFYPSTDSLLARMTNEHVGNFTNELGAKNNSGGKETLRHTFHLLLVSVAVLWLQINRSSTAGDFFLLVLFAEQPYPVLISVHYISCQIFPSTDPKVQNATADVQ